MPCPLFEPRQRVIQTNEATARFPLIYEFEGVCHAGEQLTDSLRRLRYCNHGYAKGNCASFPNEISLSATRFNVTARTEITLSVLVLEEENHWPRAWSQYEFMIQDGRLVPEIDDVCRRAQVFQFCLSYLDKF